MKENVEFQFLFKSFVSIECEHQENKMKALPLIGFNEKRELVSFNEGNHRINEFMQFELDN